MPEGPLKLCRAPGCREITRDGLCPRHRAAPPLMTIAPRPAEAERPNAAARGYCSATWRRTRSYVLARDCYVCSCCGVPVGKAGHVDHVVPKAQGGDEADENLQLLCPSCHSRKTAHETQRGGGGGAKLEYNNRNRSVEPREKSCK